MIVNRAMERDWQLTEHQGIERTLFRTNDKGGNSVMIRLKKGAHFPQHQHHGDAEMLVINGQLLIGGVELIKGDYLYARAGEGHDIVALTDAELFLTTEQAMTLIT